MQRELAVGMGRDGPDHAAAAGTDEIDAWLGFPAGLGPVPAAAAPGEVGPSRNGHSEGRASESSGVTPEPPTGVTEGPAGDGGVEDSPDFVGASTTSPADADDETVWLGGAADEPGRGASQVDPHSDNDAVDRSRPSGHGPDGRGVAGETGEPAP
jgi:hypothetical protein